MGNASAGQKERLRIEIGDMERRLIQLSIANATNAGATSKSKFVDFQSEMNSRAFGEKQKGIRLLPEAPRLTEMQKKMFADNAGKELYKKTETGKIFDYFLSGDDYHIFLFCRIHLSSFPPRSRFHYDGLA